MNLCTCILKSRLSFLSRFPEGYDDDVDCGPNGYYDEVSHDGAIIDNEPLLPFNGYDPRLRRYFNDDISLLHLPPQAFQVRMHEIKGMA